MKNMKTTNHAIVFMILSAGAASSALASNDQLHHVNGRQISPSQVGPIKHVYFNIGTGERIFSSVAQDQTVGADTGSSELIWSVDLSTHQCDGINGYTGISAIGLGDDVGDTTELAVGATWVSMGDIATDTVIDCVGFNYWSEHTDVDLDNDGNADGIPGFGIVLDWWDADNGFVAQTCSRTPLIELTFANLQGGVDLDSGRFAGFQFTVDLTTANDGESLTMEIGDSDNDPQGAVVSNPNIANEYPDFDGDGLFDWTRGMRFIQPGTFDFDDDGLLDGDVADQADTAIGMGKPAGYTLVLDKSSGDWGWETDLSVPAVATGVRTFTSIRLPPDSNGEIIHSGFVTNFAGFSEEGGLLPPSCDADDFIAAAVIAHSLYTPGEIPTCLADIDNSGTLDFFDVSAFLDAFASGGDFNDDGLTDFFDVSDFLNAFADGCP